MTDLAPFVLDVGLAEKALQADDGDIIIEGYAADFEVDRQREQFLAGAFDDACKKASESSIPLLFEHDANRQLGVVEALKVDEKGLWTRARIAKAAADAWDGAKGKIDMIRRGMMKGLSVRGKTLVRDTPAGRRIGWIDLHEVSVTPVPVQPGALFAVAQKSLAFAEDPSGSEIAWAAADASEPYTDEEILAAADAYFNRHFDRLQSTFNDLAERLA